MKSLVFFIFTFICSLFYPINSEGFKN